MPPALSAHLDKLDIGTAAWIHTIEVLFLFKKEIMSLRRRPVGRKEVRSLITALAEELKENLPQGIGLVQLTMKHEDALLEDLDVWLIRFQRDSDMRGKFAHTTACEIPSFINGVVSDSILGFRARIFFL